tara:strand:+ start:557 stop:1795 length:1239 start_codon:yes stop_codon:yes gene_type:complete
MIIDRILKLVFIFSACGILAVGFFYDNRLPQLFNINSSILIASCYAVSSILLISKIKRIIFNNLKFTLYILFMLVVMITPILWMIFGVNQYGMMKYISFTLITIPICIIICEVMSYKDIKLMAIIFCVISVVLMILGYQNFEMAEELQGQRMAVLGGGPIVFGRWLLIGSIILLFHPNSSKYLKILIVPLLIFMAFAAGSRGPVYGFFIVMCIYIFLNFRSQWLRIFYIIMSVLCLSSSVYFFDSLGFTNINLENRYLELGNPAKRMQDPTSGGYARIDRIDRSISLIDDYPFGVGMGNWAAFSNKNYSNNANIYHRDKEYAHNIILEITNESGFIVALLFLLVVIIFFISSFDQLKLGNNELTRLFYVLTMFILINTMISGDLTDSRFFFVFLSLYIASITLPNNKTHLNE